MAGGAVLRLLISGLRGYHCKITLREIGGLKEVGADLERRGLTLKLKLKWKRVKTADGLVEELSSTSEGPPLRDVWV